MKILILNGSPRCQGLISRMLDIMAEEARIRGAEVEAISIHKLQVRPCTRMHGLPQPAGLCPTRRRCAAHASKDTMGRRADCRITLLLGKHERTSESSVRPHRVRHDGRKSERTPPKRCIKARKQSS